MITKVAAMVETFLILGVIYPMQVLKNN